MDVSVRLEDEVRHTWEVYVGDACIARGLPRVEANRIRVQIQPRGLNPRGWNIRVLKRRRSIRCSHT